MCLILFAHRAHPDYPLVVAANRDEFHRRDTQPAQWWEDAPNLLAGRDLEAGGTWMGVTRSGRFAAVTNYRDPAGYKEGMRSRGNIVRDFLLSDAASMTALRRVAQHGHEYNPFSAVMHDGSELGWCSNRVHGAHRLGPGVYGLSNHLLDTPWAKVQSGKRALEALLHDGGLRARDLLALLADRTPAPDELLPHTGIGAERERWLSPRFVLGSSYGTRSSSALILRRDGRAELVERSFDPDGVEIGTTRFEFSLAATADARSGAG